MGRWGQNQWVYDSTSCATISAAFTHDHWSKWNYALCVHRFRNTGTRSPNTNFGFIGHLNKIEHGAWIALSCTAPVCFAVYSREKYTPLLHYSILFSIIQYNSLAARLQSSTCTLFCLQKCANFSLTYLYHFSTVKTYPHQMGTKIT